MKPPRKNKSKRRSLASESLARLPRITLTERQLFDLEQILVGGFAPLTGFLEEKDYKSVVNTLRLANGRIWPIPIVLDQPANHDRVLGEKVILCDLFGNPMAFFTVRSIFQADKKREALKVYGTTDTTHPGVRYLFKETGPVYVGGPVEIIRRAEIHDFAELRHTPRQVKAELKKRGWKKVVAFQTRNPMHRAHVELVRRAATMLNAKALIHPVVGLTKEGDIDHISRVRAYRRLVETRLKDTSMLSLLPLAMRMAGPREALWHALIRKNYGATHFIIGRDHAGPGNDTSGKPFYGPYEAHALVQSYASDLGIEPVFIHEMLYVPKEGRYVPSSELRKGQKTKTISGTEFRKMLRTGADIPAWFSYPEVVEELRIAVMKEKRRGAAVFLTGLSGAGKSTIAHRLYHRLLEIQDRPVTLLDGDVVRLNLSKGLGFSKEDRNANIERIGYVASEIAKHGGIAICAAIAPYAESRDKNRARISAQGEYLEVFVSAPLSVCEKRDPKGLYAKARQGLITGFTGVDDPYEEPRNPELTIHSGKTPPDKAAESIIKLLRKRGVISLSSPYSSQRKGS